MFRKPTHGEGTSSSIALPALKTLGPGANSAAALLPRPHSPFKNAMALAKVSVRPKPPALVTKGWLLKCPPTHWP